MKSLILLVHLTAGGLARMPDLAEVRLVNLTKVKGSRRVTERTLFFSRQTGESDHFAGAGTQKKEGEGRGGRRAPATGLEQFVMGEKSEQYKPVAPTLFPRWWWRRC